MTKFAITQSMNQLQQESLQFDTPSKENAIDLMTKDLMGKSDSIWSATFIMKFMMTISFEFQSAQSTIR